MDVICNLNDAVGLVYDSAVEVAIADDGIDQVSRSGRSEAYTHGIEVVKVFLQTLFAEMGADVGEVVENGFPVGVSQFRELQDCSQLLIDFQKGNIFEGQTAVGDDALKLVAQILRFVTYLIQIGTPVEGVLRTLDHHTGYRPYLWHDFRGNHAVDTAVVVVLGAACPQAQVRECLTVKVFTGKDTGSSNFCSLIAFTDFR